MTDRIARCLGVIAVSFVLVACAAEPDLTTDQAAQAAQDNAGRPAATGGQATKSAPAARLEQSAAKSGMVVTTSGYYVNLQPTGAEQRTFTIVMQPGSLRANIERLGRESGWKQVVWGLNDDYQWTGTVTVAAPDFQTALQRVLDGYPVQAVFYEGNRVLLIQPRALR